MKTLLSSFLATLAVGLLAVVPPVYAETPDGGTPAEETVCDPLRDDGVTKGLYGLCVAFCEAQNIASEDVSITEAELSGLQEAAPSGRILANYNKRKQATDPDMPCILVEEPCPCWTAEELASIDGYSPTGVSIPLSCGTNTDPATQTIDTRQVAENDPTQVATATDRHRTGFETIELCDYRNVQVVPIIHRLLSVDAGTLTHEEAAACLEQVRVRCDDLSL